MLQLILLCMSRANAKLANVNVRTSNVANNFTLIFPEFEFLKLNILKVLQIKLLYLISYKYINIALFLHFYRLLSIYVFFNKYYKLLKFVKSAYGNTKHKIIFKKITFL